MHLYLLDPKATLLGWWKLGPGPLEFTGRKKKKKKKKKKYKNSFLFSPWLSTKDRI